MGSVSSASCSLVTDTKLDACPQKATSRAFAEAFQVLGQHSSNSILMLSISCAASSTAIIQPSYMVSSEAFIKVKQLQGRRGWLPDGRGKHGRLQRGQGGLKLGVNQGQCMLLHSQLVIQSHCLCAKNTVMNMVMVFGSNLPIVQTLSWVMSQCMWTESYALIIRL